MEASKESGEEQVVVNTYPAGTDSDHLAYREQDDQEEDSRRSRSTCDTGVGGEASATSDAGISSAAEDQEIEQLKRKLAELEESLKSYEGAPGSAGIEEVRAEERRSIWVGNVHFRTKPEELQEHFKDAGTINRITILVDKFTGHPKGFAYIEFDAEESAEKALALDESVLHGRPLRVMRKRHNLPKFMLGRGGRLRPPPVYGYPYGPPRTRPYFRPRRRPPYYHPYM